ncbi:MAG TPA: glutathione S-transferase family protein [Kofleriaceae bacterium]|jgi:glutathione S-transferase|nr:glutathione S-transferase family protein [Kofleriaceae bacterium]
MRPVRLYESSIPSGNAYKISLMLSHLGIAVPVTELDILARPPETRRPEYLARNPNGRIPLLELDDGSYLAESNAILYFLATGVAGGAPYLPDDPLGRARALQWMFFEQYSHEPYVAVLKFWTLWGGLDNKRPDEIAMWKQRGQAAIDVMERHLGGGAWFTGERYGIADIALFAYTQSAGEIGFAVGTQVAGWLDRVRAQPGYVAIKVDPTRA